MADTENRIIVEMKLQELEERLASAFESAKKIGGFYSDCGGRHHSNWRNIYDKILSAFDSSEQDIIEGTILQTMSQPGVHRIMDQGCGHAQSLLGITQKMASFYPDNEFLSYGITADLKEVWLGGKVFYFKETDEQRRLVKEYSIHSFQESGRNYKFFGIEDDIHTVMKKCPYELDLIFSDNAYFHLVAPWLALKRTVDKLKVGGVAMVRTLFNATVHTFEDREMEEEEIVNNLRRNNPDYEILSPTAGQDHRVLVIIKREDIPFKTHQYLAWVDEKSFDKNVYRNARTFYSTMPMQSLFLSIDTL